MFYEKLSASWMFLTTSLGVSWTAVGCGSSPVLLTFTVIRITSVFSKNTVTCLASSLWRLWLGVLLFPSQKLPKWFWYMTPQGEVRTTEVTPLELHEPVGLCQGTFSASLLPCDHFPSTSLVRRSPGLSLSQPHFILAESPEWNRGSCL
jgi:hypothetical protein